MILALVLENVLNTRNCVVDTNGDLYCMAAKKTKPSLFSSLRGRMVDATKLDSK